MNDFINITAQEFYRAHMPFTIGRGVDPEVQIKEACKYLGYLIPPTTPLIENAKKLFFGRDETNQKAAILLLSEGSPYWAQIFRTLESGYKRSSIQIVNMC